MSSKKTPKSLAAGKNWRTPKCSLVKEEGNSVPESTANGKPSKPKTKLHQTKKINGNPVTGNTDEPSVKQKTKKFRKKKGGSSRNEKGDSSRNIDSTEFVLRFCSTKTSLRDPTVVKVMDLLSEANDVMVHRNVFVSCSSLPAAKELKAKLKELNSQNEKFEIISKVNSTYSQLIPLHKPNVLYVINLLRNTIEKDLENSFNKAKSVQITQCRKESKCMRIGRIEFTNADDVKEALAIKNRRINGSYVQVTASRSAALKMLRTQDFSCLPTKKAKAEVEDQDANDQNNVEDEEIRRTEISAEKEDNKSEDDEGGNNDDEVEGDDKNDEEEGDDEEEGEDEDEDSSNDDEEDTHGE